MKLTKSALRQMIKEEAALVASTALTRPEHAKAATKQGQEIRTGDSNLSNKERSLIQQIEDILTSIAEWEDVDLEDFRAQLNAVLVRLKNATGAELGDDEAAAEEGGDKAAVEEGEQLEEGAKRFDPAPMRREPQEGEIEIMKGRGAKQRWFYVSSAQDAMTLVRLGRNYGFPTGIIQNLSSEEVPQGYYIRE